MAWTQAAAAHFISVEKTPTSASGEVITSLSRWELQSPTKTECRLYGDSVG